MDRNAAEHATAGAQKHIVANLRGKDARVVVDG